ncbi:MAG: ferredoxin reductase [Moraxellaceae bacterium]|nr:ferredoxin reductase [Moraxellaceae bacterium]
MLNFIDRALKSPLAQVLTWPHRAETYLEFLAPRIGGVAIKATVKAVRQETNRAVSLVLEPNHRWSHHVPGQYVPFTATINGRRYTRCFTVSGIEAGCPVVTIQAHSSGIVSAWANESVWQGDIVELGAPSGDFILPVERNEPFLFIAGGSGITPIRALLDQLAGEGHQGQVDILYYVPSSADAIFLGHLKTLATSCPNVKLHLAVTREKVAGSLSGHFTPDHLKAIGVDLSKARTYVCGPTGLITAVEQHWSNAGQHARLTLERFQAIELPVVVDGEGQAVRFSDSAITTTAPANRTILDAAEAAGLNPVSGCRQGICRTCTCRKLAGQVRDTRTGQISGDGPEDIAICVSVPVTPITIEL